MALKRFLRTIEECGVTSGLKKCQFYLPQVKLCGQVVGREHVVQIQVKPLPFGKSEIPRGRQSFVEYLGYSVISGVCAEIR